MIGKMEKDRCPWCDKDIEVDCAESGEGSFFENDTCEHCNKPIRVETDMAITCSLYIKKRDDDGPTSP